MLILVISLHPNTPSHLNSVLYYEDPIVMPVLVNNDQNGEQSMVPGQLYPPGYFTNLLNDNDNQSFDAGSSFSFPILHRPSEYRPSVNHLPFGAAVPPSMDEPLPSTEDFTGMPAMPPMPTTMVTSTPQWSMPPAPHMVAMSTMASTAGMPFGWTTGPPNFITPGPPPMPLSTKPNMRKCTTTGLGPATRTPTHTTSGPANVLDEHHPKPEGAYYPPTKRIKREPVETPRKPSWAASSHPEDGSMVSLPRPPLAQPLHVTPQPAAEQSAANSGRKSSSGVSSSTYDSTYDSPSDVSPSPPFPSSSPSSSPSPAAAVSPATPRPVQPPSVQNPAPPIIPRPLEPFPEAGTLMNFPLPQIDHQGQRPAAAERYFSSLQDDSLLHTPEPYEIEMEYRNALRVRERVDWDCRRLGLRLRYLRRCQARAAERYPTARECEWQRGDFGEQVAGYGY